MEHNRLESEKISRLLLSLALPAICAQIVTLLCEAIFPYADDYMSIYCLGTVFVQLTVGMNYYISTQGFAKTAMVWKSEGNHQAFPCGCRAVYHGSYNHSHDMAEPFIRIFNAD